MTNEYKKNPVKNIMALVFTMEDMLQYPKTGKNCLDTWRKHPICIQEYPKSIIVRYVSNMGMRDILKNLCFGESSITWLSYLLNRPLN